MDDRQVINRIDALVDEEHQLEARAIGDPLSEQEKQRLQEIEVSLDQCWDLLRQRRARRAAGQDPDTAVARDIPTVEGYQQ